MKTEHYSYYGKSIESYSKEEILKFVSNIIDKNIPISSGTIKDGEYYLCDVIKIKDASKEQLIGFLEILHKEYTEYGVREINNKIAKIDAEFRMWKIKNLNFVDFLYFVFGGC